MGVTATHACVSIGVGLLVGGAVDSVLPAQSPDLGVLSPDKLISAGTAGLVIVVMWLWMKHDEKVRAEHAAALKEQRDAQTIVLTAHVESGKKVAEDFSQTANNITRTFADAAKAMDERAEKREADLRVLLHGALKGKGQ